MIISRLLFASATLFSTLSFAQAVPQALNAPGGVVHIPLGMTDNAPPTTADDGNVETVKASARPQFYFNNHRVLVTQADQQWLALVGMPLDTAIGQHTVTVKTGGKTTTALQYFF